MKTNWIHWGNSVKETSRTGPMIVSIFLCGSIVVLLAAVAYSARPESSKLPLEANRAEAASVIRQALDSPTESADVRSQLAEAGARAAQLLGDDSLIAKDLIDAANRARQPDHELVSAREDLLKAHGILTFQPLMEAELPRGYPTPGPLGEIRVKEYPAYRMAVAKGGGSAFWSLFMHIKRNDIAMTAPVEMSYGDPESTDPTEQNMAFLYGAPEMGKLGTDGNVEVIDAEPVKVVSIGFNGRRSDTKIEQARDQLMAWLGERSHYEVSGELRVLGYNSPFVPRDQQYWEVQVPIREKNNSVRGGLVENRANSS